MEEAGRRGVFFFVEPGLLSAGKSRGKPWGKKEKVSGSRKKRWPERFRKTDSFTLKFSMAESQKRHLSLQLSGGDFL